MTRGDTVAIQPPRIGGFRGRTRENCEMTPIALRDLAVLLFLAVMLVCVLLALRATQPEHRRRRE